MTTDTDGIYRPEICELIQEEGSHFLLFARSDGAEAGVAIDGSKPKKTVDGSVPADCIYNGGTLIAPQQEV